ncbi:pyridoxamine 5'-phosphate oxidase family protein [Shewanella youngdeokensis]|uniref:Pyridoxamine 5'-phosphate oxidase family protein n=1 Tax=Shewanella youngdeokensis TaxID=2999068 RepID=A0ABZ0K394_9GAMM|nr:pyridoxamine 5'-phosphate oxidase family protein [Shewanella sp. DAU334]
MQDLITEVLEFVQDSEVQYFATVGMDGKPKLRPVQMMFVEGNSPVYCTGTGKLMYQELMHNPHVEICVCEGHRWVRINGCVKWLKEPAVKQKVIEQSPLVASIYHSADNPELAAFTLTSAQAVMTDLRDSVAKQKPKVVTLC